MSRLTIFHNPRCSKSRRALELLRERGADLEIVEYLEHPPCLETLRGLIETSEARPVEFVRTNDAGFRQAGLVLRPEAGAEEVAVVLAEHPRLLQRPIVSSGSRAVIGRPPERVLELL